MRTLTLSLCLLILSGCFSVPIVTHVYKDKDGELTTRTCDFVIFGVPLLMQTVGVKNCEKKRLEAPSDLPPPISE